MKRRQENGRRAASRSLYCHGKISHRRSGRKCADRELQAERNGVRATASHTKKAHCRGFPGRKGKCSARGSEECGPAPKGTKKKAAQMRSPLLDERQRRLRTEGPHRLCLHRQLPAGQRRAWSPAPPARAQGRKKRAVSRPFMPAAPSRARAARREPPRCAPP